MRKLRLAWMVMASAAVISACQASEPPSAAARTADAQPAGTADAALTKAAAAQDDIGVDRPIRSDEIEERADMSFSGFPLREELLNLPAQGFSADLATCDADGAECSWRSGDNVIHVLDNNNILYIKMVNASDFTGRPIPALGIGMARDRATVVANVSRHLLGTTLECREPGEAGEGEGIASCGVTLGEGWIKLLFDADNQLMSARIDAYQAN